MRITTEEFKALLKAKHKVIAPKQLCVAAGLSYDAIRMRLSRGGSLTVEEELALFAALVGEPVLLRVIQEGREGKQ